MSADSYTTCPVCVARHRQVVKDARAAADKAYGKLPVEEYNQLVGSADRLSAKAAWPGDTVAEYEESNLSLDGEFYYSYSCRCLSNCGFNWKTEYKTKVPKAVMKP